MATKLVRNLYNISSDDRGAVVSIGNFDGIHLGHQALIKRVQDIAQKTNSPSAIITFEPHPAEFFQQKKVTIPRLTRFREKFSKLAELGVDKMILLTFNQSFAQISASDFVSGILVGALKISHLVVGEDFRFGFQRQGDVSLLQKMSSEFNFYVECFPAVLVDNERVSSTRVRQALQMNDLALCEKLLGRTYTMQGKVSPGNRLGRELGYPTANIFLHRRLTPVHGIYIVYVHGLGPRPLPGVASVGSRPTLQGDQAIKSGESPRLEVLLEVHLLNFNEDIYGRYVEVEFCQKLREEEYYPNLDLLKAQIKRDVADAHDYFVKQGVL